MVEVELDQASLFGALGPELRAGEEAGQVGGG
jgi:hypothetical protein